MEQNFQSTKLPTSASQVPSTGGAAWTNPSRITANDGSSAAVSYSMGGDSGASITGSVFGFQQLPDSAVIDGIEVIIDGTNTGCYGDVSLNIAGTSTKQINALNGSFGNSTDLWGLSSIDPADIAGLTVTVNTGDISGGDGTATIDYLSVTVFWHIELTAAEADVPTRFSYKVFSRAGKYLGELPNVSSKLMFPEDINSAGSLITVVCGESLNKPVEVSPLLDESGNIITTEDDEPILTTSTEIVVAPGNSPDDAIFKNSNRLKVWMYNNYYPNGKLVFSGEIDKVNFKYGGGDASVKLTVYSDGLDLTNYVARGYPFSYTNDVSQTTQNSYVTSTVNGPKGGGWNIFGQSFKIGSGVTNLGAIDLMLEGTAEVSVAIYDGPNGNFMGSGTKNVSNGGPTVETIEFPTLIDVTPLDECFYAVWVAEGQSIRVYGNNSSVYSNGSMYQSNYSGGSGGGSFLEVAGDMYFVTKTGDPTTTATYTLDDPVSEMAHGIMLDYNSRGGLITERDFEATGLSLTYTFVVAFIHDAIKKILELAPNGYYVYVDVGTAEMDIKQVSDTADFVVTRGRHINELDLALSIEKVKNLLLLSGGDVGGGVNLYQQYQDSVSVSNYGVRTATKSDNRVTLPNTANAIGASFIEENSEETQETTLTILNEHMDITLLTPGKTIGFRNFGNFIDDMVLQIVRREINLSDGVAKLSLGRLPVRLNSEFQRLSRELLDQQTIDNPSAPS